MAFSAFCALEQTAMPESITDNRMNFIIVLSKTNGFWFSVEKRKVFLWFGFFRSPFWLKSTNAYLGHLTINYFPHPRNLRSFLKANVPSHKSLATENTESQKKCLIVQTLSVFLCIQWQETSLAPPTISSSCGLSGLLKQRRWLPAALWFERYFCPHL